MKSKKRLVGTIVLIAGLLIVLLVIGAAGYVNHMLNKINYSDGDQAPTQPVSDAVVDTIEVSSAAEVTKTEPESTSAAASAAEEETSAAENEALGSEEEAKSLEEELLENLEDQSIEVPYDDDVLNILLVGIDALNGQEWSNSDTMILFSINKNTKKIVMTSLMRDIYLYIPDRGYNRINAAYSYGGPNLLMKTIRENFKINVDQYVTVNFYSFIDIVDILGGVEIDIKDYEIKNMNQIIQAINDYVGPDQDDSKITEPGTYLLNGKQTLGYARIRYAGNNDFERTERQRTVLNKLIEKAKGMDLFQLNDTLNVLLPKITTNLSKGQILSLMLESLELKDYEIVQNRIPIDGGYSNKQVRGMSVLGLDMETNIKALHDGIYN